MTLNLFEMFAGYGGLSTAIENALGARTTAVAEIEPGPSRILAHHYPHAPNLGDVTRAEWSDTGEVHVIGGGSPCQDISAAGKRRGMLHGTRSGLWASMRDAIAYHRPEFVVWENVRAATTAKASSAHDPNGTLGNLRALGRVLGDLAELGYNAEWTLARASDVGACHQRARIFLLAWDAAARPVRDWTDPLQQPFAWWHTELDAFKMYGEIYRDKLPVSGALHNGALYRRAHRSVAPPRAPKLLPTPQANLASGTGSQHPDKRRAGGHSVNLDDVTGWVMNTANGFQLLPTPKATDGAYGTPRTTGRPVERATHLVTRASYQLDTANGFKLLPTPTAADGNGTRNATANRAPGSTAHSGMTLNDVAYMATANGFRLLPTPTVGSTSPAAHGQISGDFRKRWDQALEAWGEYLPGIVHHAAALGMHDVPEPTMPGHREGSRRRLNPAFAEWMMGIPAGHVTNPELGLTRQQQLTAIGNGVMTQQAQWALTELYHRAVGVNGLH